MKVVNEEIKEATEDELAGLFLLGDYDDIYTWKDFIAKMEKGGCKIIYSHHEVDIEEIVNNQI